MACETAACNERRAPVASLGYTPRQAERTVPQQVAGEHLETFLATTCGGRAQAAKYSSTQLMSVPPDRGFNKNSRCLGDQSVADTVHDHSNAVPGPKNSGLLLSPSARVNPSSMRCDIASDRSTVGIAEEIGAASRRTARIHQRPARRRAIERGGPPMLDT